MCADFLGVLDLIKTTLMVDTKIVVAEDRPFPNPFVVLCKSDARGKGCEFEKIVSIEVLFVFR